MADLRQLFDKLGRNAGLSIRDRLDLRTLGGNLAAIESAFRTWTDPGQTSPRFTHFYAEEGEFGRLPMEMARVGTNSAQTITTSTTTILKPGDAPSAAGRTFSHGVTLDETEGSINLGKFDSPSVFLLWAHANWTTNVTGERLLQLHNADSGDPGTNLVRLDKIQGSDSNVSNAVYVWRNAAAGSDNLRLGVFQNSGGNIDITFWRFVGLRIH